jgi:ABC-2 type transport system permease protein
MKGFVQLTLTNFRIVLREPIAAFFTLAFPPLMVLLFGAMYGNQPSPMFNGYGSMDISMPAYTAMILCTVGFMNIPITTSGYREAGVLRRFHAAGVRPITYILADVVANMALILMGIVGLLLVGWLVYRVRFEGQIGLVILAVVFSSLSMFSAGYLIGSLAPGARTAQVVGMIVFYPMMFLSGASIPLEVLPAGVRAVSNALPLTYVVKLLRGLWFGQAWGVFLLETAVIAGVMLLCTVLASRFFRWE